jgi:hypothetical protein
MWKPFFADGLRFRCTRCSACCRYDPGFVFLSRTDADALADFFRMDYSSFVQVYCRWVPAGGGVEYLSLKEKSNYDCFLWGERGCSAYEARPLQCRTFPFWESITAADCPGIGQGPLIPREEIDRLSSLRAADPVVTRSV